MKILYKKPGEAPEIRDVANDLEALQKLVGGYIETVTAGDVVIICNEEGKMKGSVLIMEFEDRFGLDQYLASEPYITEHVWENVKVEPMNVVILNGKTVGK